MSWYRRYYLLVNVPLLLLITELLLVKFDVVHHLPFRDPDDLIEAEHRLAKTTTSPERPAIALLGNSALREGLDQALIEHALDAGGIPATVYNFGLSAGRLRDQEEMLERLIESGLTPKAVVVGVNLFLIDDQVNSDTVYPWNERRSPYLYFHRSRFRTTLLRAARYLIASKKKRANLAARWTDAAQFRYDRKATPDEYAGFLARLLSEFGSRPPVSYPMIGELRPFVDRWLAKGIQVYLVLLPMNPDGTAKLATYRDLMTAIRNAAPPDRTLDLADMLPADVFYDMGHVNGTGRPQLSARVGEWLSGRKELR